VTTPLGTATTKMCVVAGPSGAVNMIPEAPGSQHNEKGLKVGTAVAPVVGTVARTIGEPPDGSTTMTEVLTVSKPFVARLSWMKASFWPSGDHAGA
jgi:hypothetical protein